MTTQTEVFRAEIKFDRPNTRAVEGALERMRELALQTVAQIQGAFSSIDLDFGGLRRAAREFGAIFGALERTGSQAGVSGLRVAEIETLANAIRRLQEASGKSLPEIVENFDQLKRAIAEGAGLSVKDVEERIGGGLRQIVAQQEGATGEIEETWRKLYQILVGGSIVPEMSRAIVKHLGEIPIGAKPALQELRVVLEDTFKGDYLIDPKMTTTFRDAIKVLKNSMDLKEVSLAWTQAMELMEAAGRPVMKTVVQLGGAAGGTTTRILTFDEALTKMSQSFGGIPRASQKTWMSIKEVAEALQITEQRVHELVQANALMRNKVGGPFRIAALSVKEYADAMQKASADQRKFQATQERLQSTQKEYGALMGRAMEQTHGWRQAMSLSSDKLLALRVGFGGTARAGSTLVKAIDGLRKIQSRLTDDTTRQEKALVKQLQAYQNQALTMRNAVDVLKEHGKQLGINKTDLSQVTNASNAYFNAIRRQTQAGIANKEITKHGSAEIQNANSVLRQQLRVYRDHIAIQGKSNDQYEEMLDALDDYIDKQEMEVSVLGKRNRESKKSREELGKHERATEKQSKASKEQISIFKRLVISLNVFRRGTKETTTSTKRMSSAFRETKQNLFMLVGAFSVADLAVDALRSTIYKLTSGIQRVRDEFLGFGVIKEMMDDLFTGIAEFGAELEQMLITLRTVMTQAGYSIDFVDAKLQQLRDSNIAVAGAQNMLVRLTPFGPQFIGPLENTIEGMEQLQAIMSEVGLREFSAEIEDLTSRMGRGEAETSEMVQVIFRMAQSIRDPVKQMAFLDKAFQAGILGAQGFARAGQNIGAAFGRTTRDAVEAMANSVLRLSTENVESIGIGRNASQMWKDYEEIIGVSADSMTDLQKRTGIFLGEIKESLPLMEVYEKSYDSAGKRISSMARKIEDVKEVISKLTRPILTIFLDKFEAFIAQLKDIAQSEAAQKLAAQIAELTKQISPVGFIIQGVVDHFETFATVVGHVLEAVTKLMSGDIRGAFEGFKEVAIDALTTVALFFEDKIASAATWGWNLIVNLTNGMLEAANTVLMTAINTIGDIFNAFFGPGSPPEKGALRGILDWGRNLVGLLAQGMASGAQGAFGGAATAAAEGLVGAMTETFRNLDLSSLRAIRDAMGRIRGVFQSMISAGKMEDIDLAPALLEVRDLMAQLSDEFEKTGKVSEKVLKKIGDRLGDAGEDMTKYIRLQFELQKAKGDLKSLDEEIAAAEAAGFVPAELRKRRDAAAARIDQLGEEMELQRELLSWQQESNNLVRQQVELLKRIADQGERAAKATGKQQKDQWEAFLENYNNELAALETKKALGLITEEEYLRGRLALEQRYIDTAIKMSIPLEESRLAFFKDLKAQVEALKGKGKGGIEGLTDKIYEMNDALIGAGNDALKTTESMGSSVARLGSKFGVMRLKIQSLFDEIERFLDLPFKEKLQGISDWLRHRLPADLVIAAEEIKTKLTDAFGYVRDHAGNLLGGIFIAAFAALNMGGVARGIRGAAGGLKSVFAPLAFILSPLINTLSRMATILLGPLKTGFKGIGLAIFKMLGPLGTTALIVGGLVVTFLLLKDRLGLAKDKFDDLFAVIKGEKRATTTFQRALRDISNILQFIYQHTIPPTIKLIEAAGRAFRIFVERVSKIEQLPRLMDRILAVFKILAGVFLAAGAAVLILYDKLANLLADVLEPVAQLLGLVAEAIIEGLVVALDLLVGLVEVPFRLLTEGGKSASEAIDRIVNDLKLGLAPALLLVWGIMQTKVYASLVGFASMITKTVISAVLSLAAKIETLVVAFRALSLAGIRAGAVSLATGLKSILGGAVSFLLSPVGALAALLVALGVIVVKVRDILKDVNEHFKRGKENIDKWSDGVDRMIEGGATGYQVVKKLAGMVNKARDEFEKGGKLADVFGRGKDVELFRRAAEKTNEELIKIAGTYEEYLYLIEKYNDLVAVDSMRITEAFTKVQWELSQALAGSTDALQSQWKTVEILAEKQGFAGDMARAFIGLGGRLKQQADAARAAMQSEIRLFQLRGENYRSYAATVRKAAQTEEEFASAMVRAMKVSAPEIDRLLNERVEAEETYQKERLDIVMRHKGEITAAMEEGDAAAMASLRQKHADELAEIDDRFAQEKAKRRQAIGEALLDLNERILKEKLMTKNLTAEQVSEIETFHRGRAEAIGAIYDVDYAARLMELTAESLRTFVVTTDEIEKQTGASIEDIFFTLDRLSRLGYDALTESQRALVVEMATLNAKWLVDNNKTTDEVIDALAGIPIEFHAGILKLLEDKASLEELYELIKRLAVDIETKVTIKAEYDKFAIDAVRPMSPKTQLQVALENLVEYARDNAVEVLVSISEDIVQRLAGITEGLATMGKAARPAESDLRMSSLSISRIFWGLHDAVVGSGGAMTRMVNEIKRLIQGLTSVYAPLRAWGNQVVAIFKQTATDSVQGFMDNIGGILTELKRFFEGAPGVPGMVSRFWNWGISMMQGLADAISWAIENILKPVFARLNEYLPGSPAKKGPLSKAPDWSYLTQGLMKELGSLNLAIGGDLAAGQLRTGVSLTGTAGRRTNIYIEELSFPGVSSREEAVGIWDDLDARVEGAVVLGSVARY